MKKLILALCGIGIMAGFLYAKPLRKVPLKLKEIIEIRKQMKRIEMEAIQKDEELKKINEQIKELKEKLRKKLEEVLAENKEYQELKKKLEKIRKEWKERHQRKEADIVVGKGTVKYIPLEGGFYGIVTEEGEKYLPMNLPSEFKKDGLKVWFKGNLLKMATTQMWGKPIKILKIFKLEK
ncbi:MAG TPA: hypothetical protein ENF61_02335 [Firmicutes bacterium]|nr:MAG: hypothetical protein DRP67_06260 [Candidatus Omnitrophota bacterium]HDD64933.1 hypothetical protein [Bacillota bacterium]